MLYILKDQSISILHRYAIFLYAWPIVIIDRWICIKRYIIMHISIFPWIFITDKKKCVMKYFNIMYIMDYYQN